jgi:uncharacterized protein YutE (UPF0331/DUF86 family)
MTWEYPQHTVKSSFFFRKNGTIDEDLAQEMSRLVTCRNLLSHEYQEITRQQVFELTRKAGTKKNLQF